MDRYLAHLEFTPDFTRMLYRSRHIYILLAGLLNLALGAYVSLAVERWRWGLQLLGSILITVATVMFVLGFIYEPRWQSFHTPYSGFAMYMVFAGTLLHVISSLKRKREKGYRKRGSEGS